MRKISAAIAAVGLAVGAVAAPARAAYVVTFSEVGNNVVATGVGRLNTAGLGYLNNPYQYTQAQVGYADTVVLGPTTPTEIPGYYIGDPDFSNNTRPSSAFAKLAPRDADAGTGDLAGVLDLNGSFLVLNPVDALRTSSAIWYNSSFRSLGLIPGVYTYAWHLEGYPKSGDSFTVVIPEPATLAALACPAALLLRRRRPAR